MIRTKRLTQPLLNTWLVNQPIVKRHATYRLRVWRENPSGLADIRAELLEYFDEAFEDARKRIRRGFEDDLSPFANSSGDPAANYPALLHRITLQGYFGEVLTALTVENLGAHGHTDWIVPAFLFRLHDQEFQHLEEINVRLASGETYDSDAEAERRPGRTGDDGLAFRIRDDNTITDILTLEAKCLATSNSSKIEEAYQKLSNGIARPSGVRELINILDEYHTPESQRWQEALLRLWKNGYRDATRYDGVGYVCGNRPARGGRISWLPTDEPHPVYTVQRNLEGMEFQLENLTVLIDVLFRGA